VQVLRLPYVDQDFAFEVALPAVGGNVAAAEGVLGAPARWQAALKPQMMAVTLPRFRVENGFRLVDDLRALGLVQATAPGAADFTGIDGGAAQLYIGEVVHKTFLDVAERGTEAAAATAVLIKDGGGPPARAFTADRPFAFALRDLKTGLVLFAGHVADPRPPKA
jgi:serpin B